MISMWVCVTDEGFFFHRPWLWITLTDVLVFRASLSILSLHHTVSEAPWGVSYWNVCYEFLDWGTVHKICYRCRPGGWVSWKRWILWIVIWLQSTYRFPQKFYSTTSAAYKLVARERDGIRSWNTPSGVCLMRCKSSCLSVLLLRAYANLHCIYTFQVKTTVLTL